MRYLVKVHKVDPNSPDTKRLTPLHTLSMSGHAEAIKELVQVREISVGFAVEKYRPRDSADHPLRFLTWRL
jgi:ankyrin repeat protein